MSRPLLIGVSSYARDNSDPPAFTLPCGYIDSIRAAGAVPVVLTPGESEPERLLDVVDALVLAGGGDISPKFYDRAPHHTVYSLSDERDSFELDLARAAAQRADLPLLCICRGLQVLNVALGGSLLQHLPDVVGEKVPHRLPPRKPTFHPVRIEAESLVGRIVGTARADVCSWHHQAVDRFGEGLRPVAWADDGVVEAVELEGNCNCIAVQWHPEMQLGDPTQARIFAALVERAKSNRRMKV